MALSLATSMSASARWRMVQGMLLAARDTGEPPVLRALRVAGTGWVAMAFWGMRFRPDTLAELQAEPLFSIARGRGEVAELLSTSSPLATAPSWIIAISSASRPPAYLPPGASEVGVQLKGGGTGRYRLETLIYPLASN